MYSNNNQQVYWINYQKKIMGTRLSSGKVVPVEAFMEKGAWKFYHPENGKKITIIW